MTDEREVSMRGLHQFLIGGFGQEIGRVHGLLRLREALLMDGHSEGVRFRVTFIPWWSDFRRFAGDLQAIAAMHGMQPWVHLVGYSYGGWAACRFASHLEDAGIAVARMTLCDPVPRPDRLPKWIPAASSMLPRDWSARLRIPNNVSRLQEFHQRVDLPQGARLIVPAATVRSVVRLKAPHVEMDDQTEFHVAVRNTARILRNELLGADGG